MSLATHTIEEERRKAEEKDRIEAEVMAFAEEVGDSLKDIYAWLEDEGIKGIPEEARDCPLARAVNRRLPEGYRAFVDGSYIEVENDVCISIDTGNHALDSFVKRFDKGHFPELEESS